MQFTNPKVLLYLWTEATILCFHEKQITFNNNNHIHKDIQDLQYYNWWCCDSAHLLNLTVQLTLHSALLSPG